MAKEVIIGKKQATFAKEAVNYPGAHRKRLAGTTKGTQTQFWQQYGVTQSGGSRYENARDINTPLRILMVLHLSGTITDEQLGAARAIALQ